MQKAISIGIDKDKLILGKVFTIPGFEWEKYLSIKKKGISIISNYCIGGMLYHTFGLEFKSPTINMFCGGKDFIKFVSNLEYYLEQELLPYKNDIYIPGTLGLEQFVEKGIIDNEIVWNFNHDIYSEDAIEKWNRRKCRVNKDYVYIVMIIQNDADAYAFEQLKTKRKIGFYYKDLGLKSIVPVKEWNDKKIRWERGFNFTMYVNWHANYEIGCDKIDWLKFLNDEEDYIRRR